MRNETENGILGGQGRTAASVRDDGIGWLVVAAIALGALALLAAAAAGGAS